MFRMALKGALARKLRLALTAVSIILGVAFVSGTYVLTDTLNATFERLFGTAEAGVSAVVRGPQARSPADSTLAGATLTTFTAHQAQVLLLGRPDVWTTVQATAAAGISQPVLASRVARALEGQPSLQVLTQKAYVKSESKAFKDQLKFFNI